MRAPFSAEWPLEVVNILTLTECAGKTTMTMRGFPINAMGVEHRAFEAGFESMQKGWTETLDQLAASLPVKELVLAREFDVPRDLVFRAWTDPKQMAKWWGPRGFTNPVCEMDETVGRKIRIDTRGPDGTDYPMTGRFDEAIARERLIFTYWAHCDASGKAQIEVINSVTFVEQNGKTKMTLHTTGMKTTAEAAAALAGMDLGWTESLVRLEEFARTSARAEQ